MEPLTHCGKIPEEIRKKVLEGKTPNWVPEKQKKDYNTIEKASIDLADIQCAPMRFVDSWITKTEILHVRVQRESVINDLEIGRIPGIKKTWVKDGKLYYTYVSFDFWGKLKYGAIGFFTGGGFVALLLLLL